MKTTNSLPYLVPADKASNNIIIICKTLYLSVLYKELGINSLQNSETYTLCNKSPDDIIKKHQKFLSRNGMLITPLHLDLPLIYWIPKLHKSPYKARFIAGSKKCTTKNLSGLLTRALQRVKHQHDLYCQAIYRNTGINRMWILKNSQLLISDLHDKHIKKVSSISTWDFSTLYTTIPHKQLKKLEPCEWQRKSPFTNVCQ